MSRADWRSPDGYEDLRSLDAPAFAYEYLRRSADFLRERQELERAARNGALDPAVADAFAQRWGLRCWGDGQQPQPRRGALDCPSLAQRYRSYGGCARPCRS